MIFKMLLLVFSSSARTYHYKQSVRIIWGPKPDARPLSSSECETPMVLAPTTMTAMRQCLIAPEPCYF